MLILDTYLLIYLQSYFINLAYMFTILLIVNRVQMTDYAYFLIGA